MSTLPIASDCSNTTRESFYRKSVTDESFLQKVGEALASVERAEYVDHGSEFPFLFVLGVPRSGTTLLTQTLIHSLDVGYVNNFIARFWLAPVTGTKLSRVLFERRDTDFCSNYATTLDVTDVHGFGYFWRHWLKIEDRLPGKDVEIDWEGLRLTLLNMQYAFGKGICGKNLFSTFYVPEFVKWLPRVLFVYIERDPFDTMVSILKARREFYGDELTWWSSAPLEYPQLKSLGAYEQVAGQVYYLRKLFEGQFVAISNQHVVRVTYKELCTCPEVVREKVVQGCQDFCDFKLDVVDDVLPNTFEYRQYPERDRNEFRRVCRELGYML